MKRLFVVLALVIPFSLGLLLMSCGDDLYRHHDLMMDSGDYYAKDKTAELRCDVDDLVIQDCYDACNCCYYDQEENTENCVHYCDDLLIKQMSDDVEPTKADYTAFKECVLGCVSLCGMREKDDTCWVECKHHLGL